MTRSWKGSVKSQHLVLAIRDFYVDQLALKSPERFLATPPSDQAEPIENAAASSLMIGDDEEWAVEYIDTFRLRPLVRALDPDSSGFVTISEVNKFSSSRPENWR